MHIVNAFLSIVGSIFFSTSFGGSHGIGTGVHGGFVVPKDAIKIGFDGLMHIPKGGMFMNGTMSIIVAINFAFASTFGLGTIKEAGACPKLHRSSAPIDVASINLHAFSLV